MAYRTNSYGELTGYPALVFVELKEWGRNQQTYMECLRGLHRMYSHLNAKLPLIATKENEDQFQEGLESIDDRIRSAIQLYNPDFESPATWPTGEDAFNVEMFGIYTDLDRLIAAAHLIDNIRMTSTPAPGADE